MVSNPRFIFTLHLLLGSITLATATQKEEKLWKKYYTKYMGLERETSLENLNKKYGDKSDEERD